MSRSAEVNAKNIVVGVRSGLPLMINSGLLDLVTAVTEQGAFYVPFDATIISIRSRVRVACGTAAGLAKVGTPSDDNAFGEQSHATTDTAGTEFEWTITSADVAAGTVIVFSGDGGATTNGSCDVTVTLAPKGVQS